MCVLSSGDEDATQVGHVKTHQACAACQTADGHVVRRMKVARLDAEQLLATRFGPLPSAGSELARKLASSEVLPTVARAQRLVNRCPNPTVGHKMHQQPGVGPNWAKSTRLELAEITNFVQLWPAFGQHLAELGLH